jgi:hypothetical protein
MELVIFLVLSYLIYASYEFLQYTSADEKRRRSSADLIKALDPSMTVRLGVLFCPDN